MPLFSLCTQLYCTEKKNLASNIRTTTKLRKKPETFARYKHINFTFRHVHSLLKNIFTTSKKKMLSKSKFLSTLKCMWNKKPWSCTMKNQEKERTTIKQHHYAMRASLKYDLSKIALFYMVLHLFLFPLYLPRSTYNYNITTAMYTILEVIFYWMQLVRMIAFKKCCFV